MEHPESIPEEIVDAKIEEIVELADDVSAEDETDQQSMEYHELQEITKETCTLGKQTAWRFREIADTLDLLWETCRKAQAGGTALAILGGILAIGGGIATISSAGAAAPLMLTGIGFGFGGAGTKIVASFIEAAINSDKIKKAEEEWKKTFKGIKNMENELREWVERSGKVRPSVVRSIDLARRITSNSVLLFCALNAELQAAGQVSVQATANVGGKVVTKAGLQEVAKAGLNTVDDATAAVAKASTKALGKVIIGVSAVFLVVDVVELGCTIHDLVKEKGADAAKVLRAKAEELERICSVF